MSLIDDITIRVMIMFRVLWPPRPKRVYTTHGRNLRIFTAIALVFHIICVPMSLYYFPPNFLILSVMLTSIGFSSYLTMNTIVSVVYIILLLYSTLRGLFMGIPEAVKKGPQNTGCMFGFIGFNAFFMTFYAKMCYTSYTRGGYNYIGDNGEYLLKYYLEPPKENDDI